MRLSIIVPIYGVERYLRQCVDSILNQTFRDFELLLVDDGSRDGCPGICDEYARRDARIKVVHKANGGYGSAMNCGLTMAKGDWIGIVEPDDWIAPAMYHELMARTTADVDVVKCNFTHIREWNGTEVANSWTGKPPEGIFKVADCPVFLEQHPSIWSCAYRASFLRDNNIRFKEIPGAGWVDNPFCVATLCTARGISFVNRCLYNYRATRSDAEALRGNWRIPYERTLEMCDWLVALRVRETSVWATVFRHVVYYLWLMSQMVDSSNREEVVKAVRTVARRFDGRFGRGPWLNRMWRQVLWYYRNLPRIRIARSRSLVLHRILRIIDFFVLWV